MPKNLFQNVIFTLMMSFLMVYVKFRTVMEYRKKMKNCKYKK